MLEQQLADRFRAVVDDEPPLALDPDELVDRLLRTRRRGLGVAAALGVVVVATIAFGAAAVSGPATGDQRVAARSPAPPPAPAAATITATVPAGAHDIAVEQREHESVRSVSAFLVDAVPTDRGALELLRDGEVLFRADLAELDGYVFRPAEPVLLKPGQRVLVAVSCHRTLARTGACHVDVTFSVLVVAR